MKSSPSIWHYVVSVSVKSTAKISSIFVAFLENTNFNSAINTKFVLLIVGLGRYGGSSNFLGGPIVIQALWKKILHLKQIWLIWHPCSAGPVSLRLLDEATK